MKKLLLIAALALPAPLALANDAAPVPAPDWPRDASPRPARHEWRDSKPLALTRSDDPRCRARRLRDWVQIRCTFWGAFAVAMIAGNKAGVGAWVVERSDHESTAVIELRVRPGDRRVFQVNGIRVQ